MSVKKNVKNKQTANYNSIELLDAHSNITLFETGHMMICWFVGSPVKSEDTVLFDKNVETSITIVPRVLCLLLPGD